jgi:hypothetical protein
MTAAATVVYTLCLLTSAIVAWLLVRGYMKTRTTVLLWSAACFVMLAANNLFLVIDLLVFPEIFFTPLRTLAALSGVSMLIYGFVFELD